MKNIRVQRSRSSSPCWAECVERSQDIAPDKKRFKHSLGVGVPEIELEPSNLPARNKKLCEHCESVGSFQKQMQRRLQKNWQSYRVKGTAISMMEKNDPISNFKGFVTFFLTVKISIRVWLPSFACADACVCVCVCAFDARHAAVFVVWEQDTAFCLIIDQRRCVAFRVLSAIIYWWNNNFNKTPSIHTHAHAHTHTHTSLLYFMRAAQIFHKQTSPELNVKPPCSSFFTMLYFWRAVIAEQWTHTICLIQIKVIMINLSFKQILRNSQIITRIHYTVHPLWT